MCPHIHEQADARTAPPSVCMTRTHTHTHSNKGTVLHVDFALMTPANPIHKRSRLEAPNPPKPKIETPQPQNFAALKAKALSPKSP